MLSGEEIFGLGVMAVGVVVGIAAFDFILRNVPDALDDSADQFANADDPRLVDVMRAADDGDLRRGGDGQAVARRGNKLSHTVSNRIGNERLSNR